MKKILFATTALIATTGMAAAELTFGGYGRFGLVYDEGADETTGAQETRIEQRFRLTVTGIAETDGGVKFEGRIRFQSDDNSNGTAQGDGPGAAGFAVSTGGLRVDVGHISDVLDSGDTVDYYGYGIGLTSFLEQNSSFYDEAFLASGFGDSDGDSRQKVKLRYSAGSFAVSASFTPEVESAGPTVAAGNGEDFQIGASYSFGDHSVGFVYGDYAEDSVDTDGFDFWVIGANGSFGDFSYSAIVGEADDADTNWGLSGAYSISAATELRAIVSGGGTNDETAYGVGFRHSLGGGVSLRGGVGRNTSTNTQADLGVIFNF